MLLGAIGSGFNECDSNVQPRLVFSLQPQHDHPENSENLDPEMCRLENCAQTHICVCIHSNVHLYINRRIESEPERERDYTWIIMEN